MEGQKLSWCPSSSQHFIAIPNAKGNNMHDCYITQVKAIWRELLYTRQGEFMSSLLVQPMYEIQYQNIIFLLFKTIQIISVRDYKSYKHTNIHEHSCSQ